MRRSGFSGRGKPLENKGGGLERRTRLNPVSPRKSDRRHDDQAWSEAVWMRDRGICQAGPTGDPAKMVPEVECGGRRDPHHIFPKGAHPHLRHDVDNGITLCRRHHDWVHFQNPAEARRLGLKGGADGE